MAERTMRRFWQRVKVYQRQVPAETPGEFRAVLRDFLTQERAQFTRALGVSSAVVLVAVGGAVSASANRVLLGLSWDATTLLIFIAGLADQPAVISRKALSVENWIGAVNASAHRPIVATRRFANRVGITGAIANLGDLYF